jgi:hypothetical protein
MKVPGIVAVMVLSAASMWAQAATAAPDTAAASAAQAATPAPDAAKPGDHAACKRDKSGQKMCCRKKHKDGNMAKEMDGNKHGKCAREKHEAEKKI